MDRARRGTELRVVDAVDRLAHEVDELRLALQQRQERERAIAMLLCGAELRLVDHLLHRLRDDRRSRWQLLFGGSGKNFTAAAGNVPPKSSFQKLTNASQGCIAGI